MKVERVSYDVMTPSAARGILEAIYWKPEIRWVLNPIRFTSIRRNEVKDKVSLKNAGIAMRKGSDQFDLCVEESRTQRTALLLRDVSYVVEAHFEIVSGEANEGKHLDQFQRRARAGQCFTRPFFGCREFAADFRLLEPEETLPSVDPALTGERDLGWILQDVDFAGDKEPRFFQATMVDGVIEVPPMRPLEARL
jgi:CRISPR-associated protein Cas5d